MDGRTLQSLKEGVERCKAERAKCLGQEQQLDIQKKELMKEFDALGVTRDTLPAVISQLEADITEAEKEINLVLNSIKGTYD